MANTYAQRVLDSFESTFADKCIIPHALEIEWLAKAVAYYSLEIEPLTFNRDTEYFNSQLSEDVIYTLGLIMKKLYQEREVSKVNKRASIVTRDISYDGSNGTKTSERMHLEYVTQELREMLDKLKPTAYV